MVLAVTEAALWPENDCQMHATSLPALWGTLTNCKASRRGRPESGPHQGAGPAPAAFLITLHSGHPHPFPPSGVTSSCVSAARRDEAQVRVCGV